MLSFSAARKGAVFLAGGKCYKNYDACIKKPMHKEVYVIFRSTKYVSGNNYTFTSFIDF